MRRYKEPEQDDLDELQCDLEDEVVAKVGNSQTKERHFNENIRLVDFEGNETFAYGFYTYNGVFILDSEGMDCSFLGYEERTRKST